MTTRTERSSPRWAALGLLMGLGIGTGPAEAQNLILDCAQTITEPGSYRLADDLECEGNGIIIEADGVRLSLGSRTLTGSGEQGVGVIAGGSEDDPITGLSINGGTITGFDTGISLDHAPGARIAGVTTSNNLDDGIFADDIPRALILGNTAADNLNDGIVVFDCDRCRIIQNQLLDNADEGMVVAETTRARVVGNRATGNAEDGIDIDGEEADDNQVVGNWTTGNFQSGIEVSSGATGNRFTGNESLGNGLDSGFDMEDQNLPEACVNTWRGNTFDTDNEGDGPGAGCIR